MSFMVKGYFITSSGTAQMQWLESGRAKITCVYSNSMCWGIGTQDGRAYIDLIGVGSWWINSVSSPVEDPEGSNIWIVGEIQEPKLKC